MTNLFIWLSSSSKCAVVPNFIKIGWFFIEIWRFYNLQYGGNRPSWMSRDFYRYAILLPCAKFHWNRAIGCWVMAKNDFLIWRLSAILNLKKWSRGHARSRILATDKQTNRRNIAITFPTEKNSMAWLPDGWKILKTVTDGETDTARWHRPHLRIASRGKKILRKSSIVWVECTLHQVHQRLQTTDGIARWCYVRLKN